MFKNFCSKFEKDDQKTKPSSSSLGLPFPVAGFEEFFLKYSNCSFNKGLYRTHSLNTIENWNKIVGNVFPQYSSRIHCFGYDWLGRHFALDKQRLESGEALVLMLEPGTGEVLEIPVNFIQFHEIEIVEYANEALASNFFQDWLSAGNEIPKIDQCVGYKKPLFLSGSDTTDNLKIIDMEVYWNVSGQLLEQVRGLPIGTKINDITIS